MRAQLDALIHSYCIFFMTSTKATISERRKDDRLRKFLPHWKTATSILLA